MNYRLWKVYLNIWRVVPFYVLCKHCKFKDRVKMDIAMWKEKNKGLKEFSDLIQFGYFAMNMMEFRNIMLNRLHRNKISYIISRILFKPLESLYINMPPEKIGGGLYFQHGFSTIVAAKEIGENCFINQQVTIGYNGKKAPIIGDNVRIAVGAIVIGDVYIDDGAIVAAGAVVKHNVELGDVVAGVPAVSVKNKMQKSNCK